MNEAQVSKDFAGVNMAGLRSLLNAFDQSSLKSQVDRNGGVFRANLDGKDLELKHKTHFFLNAREMQ